MLEFIQRSCVKHGFQTGHSKTFDKVEDLIGLKLQAIANNAARRNIDMPDIENLILVNKDKIDWKLILIYSISKIYLMK